jgi:hypothetical protein
MGKIYTGIMLLGAYQLLNPAYEAAHHYYNRKYRE